MSKVVLTITGGGTGVIGNILSKGGASSWFVEGNVPYSKESLVKFLGYEPEKFVSKDAANQMALRSYLRAIELGFSKEEAIGIGSTAVLGKIEGERVGRQHSCYLAVQNYKGLYSHIIPIKGNNREEEEYHLSKEIEQVVNSAKDGILLINNMLDGSVDIYSALNLILESKRSYVMFTKEIDRFPHSVDNRKIQNSVLYSGSFNPFHEGHAQVIRESFKDNGKKVWLEISVYNVDKPPINLISLRDRLFSIQDGIVNYKVDDCIDGIILTNTPKFYDKLWMLPPDVDYLIGSDTAKRLVNPMYGDVAALLELAETNGNRFIICQRPGHEYIVSAGEHHRRFKYLDTVGHDISSTQIRNGK